LIPRSSRSAGEFSALRKVRSHSEAVNFPYTSGCHFGERERRKTQTTRRWRHLFLYARKL
jgi:hypothetical protein